MDIDTIGLLGFVFAATALAALLVEWRMDVMRYIEARERRRAAARIRLPEPVRALVERLFWSTRNAVYLASIAAC